MKISGVGASPLTVKPAPGRAGGKQFREVLSQISRPPEPAKDFHNELQGLYQRMAQGHRPNHAELLLYQVKAGEYCLRVELVSKAAETGLATLRKFQNVQ